MLELKNYSLKLGKRILLDDVSVSFETGKVNHLLGKNGVGKSQFAKDLLLNHSHYFEKEMANQVTVISSFANIPQDLRVRDLLDVLPKNDFVSDLLSLLHLENINQQLVLKRLSDGQKQKLKILFFFSESKPIIVLDELSNALDKKTTIDIYQFLNQFVARNPEKLIINITHNLADLKNISGNLFLLTDQKIVSYSDVNQIVEDYTNV